MDFASRAVRSSPGPDQCSGTKETPVASLTRIAIAALLFVGILGSTRADDGSISSKELQPLIEKGAAALRKSQSADGSWSAKRTGPGATALIVAALLRNGVSPEDPMVAKALAYLESKVQKDGGIYDKFLANYTTSVALMAVA